MKLHLVLLLALLATTSALYYDGLDSYSIYPRLDLHVCRNNSFSFDFTVSTSLNKYQSANSNKHARLLNKNGPQLLIYAEQQIQTGSTSRSFSVRLVNENVLVVNDYWSSTDIQIKLPADYQTSWFRFIYSRYLNAADISLYKFEPQIHDEAPKMLLVFSKKLHYSNYVEQSKANEQSYSQLLVGGIGEGTMQVANKLGEHVSNFHGYIMNLQYTSDYSAQCRQGQVCQQPEGQRHYAIFSSSTSKKYKLKQSLMMDDICESDTLIHDMCPKDCSCLSNNFKAPFFSCDCKQADDTLSENQSSQSCNLLFNSLEINLDDAEYFSTSTEEFEYPMLPSFTKTSVANKGTKFNSLNGIEFNSPSAHLDLDPTEQFLDAESACFWHVDNCRRGFVQHMIMSVDHIDESKFNQKVMIFVNGHKDEANKASKFIAYIHKNRMHFSIYEADKNIEWLVSSPVLTGTDSYIGKSLKITLTWIRDGSLSLHFNGFLIDKSLKALDTPLNEDIYSAKDLLNKHSYEIGIKLMNSNAFSSSNYQPSQLDFAIASSLINHQFTLKYIRRDFYNDNQFQSQQASLQEQEMSLTGGSQDSKIIVSSPLPSEIIRIDNTQRVMYKIDSPLTGVTKETIDLAFKTSQSDGVVFYITNNPIVSYFELVDGLPVAVIDTRYKNVHLKPIRCPRLDDDRWHEVSLHRDGQKIGITIDSQYYDSESLGAGYNQILTGGHVYLGIADPTNINLSHKKAFNGEMVRGKVTINNVQQNVIQKPYTEYSNVAWSESSSSSIVTNQTVNIDTSQLVSKDGKAINIIINVYGPPGFSVNGVASGSSSSQTIMETADTHYIYLDKLPNTKFVSVARTDTEAIDFRITKTRLDSFLIKFQTRNQFGQLVTLINNRNSFVGLEIYNGYVFATSSYNGKISRNQISRVKVDDGRIYQVNMKQEQEKLLCWLDADDSYKSSILYYNPIPISTVRVAGRDGDQYGFSSNEGFIGCIGAVHLNERDVIDINYQYVPMERKQSCQRIIDVEQPSTTQRPPVATTQATHTAPQPVRPPSLGYISFSGAQDILTYNFFYDHEKPNFEDISFIFRTVTPHGILFSAHNDDNHRPNMIGAYLKEGKVHVVFINTTYNQYVQDLHFEHTRVDDGSLYRLNIRRNINGQGFIQLQSYESVKALDFHTQAGPIKLTKILVGGADQWSRSRFFATRPDFVGCIIDLFQINGNSVIKPAEIPKQRYNCQIDMKNRPTSRPPTTDSPRPTCLPAAYPVSFTEVSDAITYQHETSVCDHIHIPFRTTNPRGILYSHSSNDGQFFVIAYLKRGFLNVIVRDSTAIERELELNSQRVDDGQLHKLDINCENGFLVAYIDQNRNVLSNRLDLESPLYFNTYTIGYFNTHILSAKFGRLDNFRGCVQQVMFNDECLIHERLVTDRNRLRCQVQPITSIVQPQTSPTCVNTCADNEECVVELTKNSYVLYNANEAGAKVSPNDNLDSIRLMFRVLDQSLQDQELITIFNYDRSIRVFLDNGLPVVELRGQKFSKLDTKYNDGQWHTLNLDKRGDDLLIKVDNKGSSVRVPFSFDLFGDGRIFFGSTVGRDSYFRGLLKNVYVKYSNVEYDIVAASKDSRAPGVTCSGNVLVRSDEDTGLSVNFKDSLSTWRFRGINSGDIEFVPYLHESQKAELSFQFNTSMTNGNIMCTKDDTLALNVELVNSILAVSITDIRTRRVLLTTNCRPKPGTHFNDKSLHSFKMVKKGTNQFEVVCDDQEPQALYFRQQHGEDVPFVSTKYGVSFGIGCFEQTRKFTGDLSQIVYIHDGVRQTFDELQYSEDPRFSYEGYVEFRPEFISQVYADPKPISFRSKLSSATFAKWDQSKMGRLSFEFKQEISGEDGFLFSTETDGAYFGIAIKDGYLESILSPHRIHKSGSSNIYDRFQRLFPKNKVNDGNWHRIELNLVESTVGKFVLDDELSAEVQFPFNYWTEESDLVFGNNVNIERGFKANSIIGSFRGCIRNVIVNSKLIDWSDNGALVNVEAGCYNYKFPPAIVTPADSLVAQLNGKGCVRYSAQNERQPSSESLELMFKSSGDKMVLVDSLGGGFLVHLQGPGVVIRNKADTASRIVMERGISFNDGNLHKLVLTRTSSGVELVLDGKYKAEFRLRPRTQFADFFLGCARDRQLNMKFLEVSDLVGSIQNVVYTANDKAVNLIKSLDEPTSPLVQGSIQWSAELARSKLVSTNSVMFKEPNSFLKLQNLNLDTGSTLKFLFKTNEPNGLLGFISPSTPFYSTSQNSRHLIIPNYMAIELVDGMASLLINLGNNIINRIECGALKLNDNKWHQIQVKRERLGAPSTQSGQSTATITFGCDEHFSRIKVDEVQKFSLSMFTAGNVTGNTEHYLPSDLYHSQAPKFYGCISDFEVSGSRINLYHETSPESRSKLVNGCHHDLTGHCHTMFGCLNQGECVEGFSRAFCNCDSVSYTGERCELPASTLTFNGTQGLEYTLTDLNKLSSEDLTLRFRSPLANGVLFALKKFENQPSLVLSLENGRVKVVYDRTINDKVIYLGTSNQFNDNNWNTVNIKRFGQHVTVTVVDAMKNKYSVSDQLGDDFKYCSYRFVQIGDIGSEALSQEHPNFIGWIQSVRFNQDDLLDYYANGGIDQQKSVEGNAELGENSLLMHHQLTFTGDCPVNVVGDVQSSDSFNVRMYFKTSQPDGVLFIRQGKNSHFVALELSNGILKFIFELGGGIKVLESSMVLNDKNWHEVTLSRFDRQKFSMKIDEFAVTLVDAGTSSPRLSELNGLVIGGVLPSQRYLKTGLNNKGFMGCLASVEVNNKAVDLYSSRLQLCSSVQRGCVDSVCNPNPCSNNGVCEIVNNQVSCDCKMTSYTGQLCKDDNKFYFFGGSDINTRTCGLVKYTLDTNQVNKESDNLSFGFTTTIPDALLIRIESENGGQYLEIKLRGGFVLLELNINGVLEKREYMPVSNKQFNDNRYYVVQYKRVRNSISFRVDNFEKLEFELAGNGAGIFHSAYVYAGSSQDNGNFLYCYYGVMSGMVLNGHSILDIGIKTGSVSTVESKYISDESLNSTRYIDLLPDGYCPLGYNKTISSSNYLCIFVGCPLYSDFLGDYTCRCYYSFYHTSSGVNECKKINETVVKPVLQYNNKLIPAKAMVAETPLGLILGIISGVGLALLAAAIGARKCADGLCIPVRKKRVPVAVPLTTTTTEITTNDELLMNRRLEQQVPLIQRDEYRSEEQYARDTLDFGYRAGPYQQVTEVTEMYEQTLGGPNGTTLVTHSVLPTTVNTYNAMGHHSSSHMNAHHSSSCRNLAMDSMLYQQNSGSAEYELANVTCVTMTPNGKYAIIGQSNGTPQIWDTISGQLIRSMSGTCSNCSNLTLACNGTLLVGLASDGSDSGAQSLQVWEVQTGKPILMSHQIKCCVFALSADTNSIFMAGNQRFGRGISVGILDLVSNELTKEIKSDPTISFGDNPEAIVVTPDERHAVVACRSLSGTNFIVFDITKSTEIAQTRSIALDAEPKVLLALSNSEMVTGTRGGHLIQWNIHSCAPTFTFEDPADLQAHRGPINSIQISSDYEFIVSASSDCTAKIWSSRNKMLVSILAGHRSEVTCSSISNNDLVVTGSNDQTVNLWRLHTGAQISSMAVNMNLIEANMAKHNKTIVAIGEKDGEQQLLMLRVVSVQR